MSAVPLPELKELLAAERAGVERAIDRASDAAAATAPHALAAPLRYVLGLRGKRVRGLLCIAAYGAVKRSASSVPDAVYDVAAAIELIHTYSLVHDDLPCMDDDDLRRGRATAHKVFGTDAATLAGAALIPLACAWLARAGARLGLDPRERGQLVLELMRAAGGGNMVGGQLLDLDAEGRSIDLAALEEIHRRKTGALFEASLRIGGLAAPSQPATIDALGECGRAIGLAFQVTDDLLDETADSAVLGKTAGRDRARAKATFPALLGETQARARARAALADARTALARAGIDDDAIHALARFAVERER